MATETTEYELTSDHPEFRSAVAAALVSSNLSRPLPHRNRARLERERLLALIASEVGVSVDHVASLVSKIVDHEIRGRR